MKELSGTLRIISDANVDFNCCQIKDLRTSLESKLTKRSLVFCLCSNTVGSLIGYIAFIDSKVVPVMLDAKKDVESLRKLANIYRPNYIWAPKDNKFVEGLKSEFAIYNYGLYKYSDEPVEMHDELGLLLTTSGSTGSPKLVRLSYKNIISNAKSIADYLHIDENERPITSLPMYYSYGLSVINSHIMRGATILLTDKPVIQKDFWNFAVEQKATSISGVPFTYEVLRRLRIFNMYLPHLRTMTQAGGKLNANIAKEYIEQAYAIGKKFIVMYGQTEATARMSYLPWNKAKEKYSSIGVAIPGGKFSLIDEKNNIIDEPDKDGELIYEGQNVSLGYAECREDLSRGDDNHGILHTGDIAHRDADGFYYITGRMKRFVKIYGNRVNLDATEQLLKDVTTGCACVGVDDKLTVFITDVDKTENIKSYLVKKTGLNPGAFNVRTISSIPKNNAGKILYAQLNKMLLQ